MVAAAALFVIGVDRIFEGPLWAAEMPKVVTAGQVARGRAAASVFGAREMAAVGGRNTEFAAVGGRTRTRLQRDSCVACHSLGGVEGRPARKERADHRAMRRDHLTAKASQLHPGLSLEGSATVLHRSSVLPSYVKWRQDRLRLADTVCEPHLFFDMLAAGLPLRLSGTESCWYRWPKGSRKNLSPQAND